MAETKRKRRSVPVPLIQRQIEVLANRELEIRPRGRPKVTEKCT